MVIHSCLSPAQIIAYREPKDISTVFAAAAGSAASPSFTFSTDLDTGMYHSATNTIGFSAGGSLIASVATTGLAVTGLISATTTLAAGTTVTGGTGVIATTGTVQAVAGKCDGRFVNSRRIFSFLSRPLLLTVR